MPLYFVDYDYGTGSTYLAVIAESEEQVLSELDRIRLVDAATFEPSHRKRLEGIAKPLSDAFWNEMRKRSL